MLPIRAFRIAAAIAGLLLFAARRRISPSEQGPSLPQKFRATLERLGPTFVKFGQALSLRRDLLPDDYLQALRDLHDKVGPFPAELARREVEQGLDRPIAELFEAVEDQPMAAASIAQVHRARLKDGRAVIVKVRRPDIRLQIDRDMRTLLAVVRVVLILVPRLARFQPGRLVLEVWTNLRKETDFRQEARNTRRFVEAFKGWDTIYVPEVVDDLVSEAVLVQTLSGGRCIDEPGVQSDGPRLAQVLVEAYLHQFFVVGLFHGDPHPGNLFITPEGRICFHDFGLVGYLSRESRRGLAMFLQGFVHQDAGWTLDAAIDLGILGGEMDRQEFVRGIEEILGDYAALPLKDWALAEAFLRVARLGSGRNIAIPHNLLVLMRALFIVESTLRTLDPEFRLLDTLLARGAEMLKALMREGPPSGQIARLEQEAVLTAQDLPGLLAVWLHKVQREGGQVSVSIHHQGLETFEGEIRRSSNRIAVAMVTLGLYVAASLLMLHSVGPRVFGDVPLLALVGYGFALWLSWRLLRSVRQTGGL